MHILHTYHLPFVLVTKSPAIPKNIDIYLILTSTYGLWTFKEPHVGVKAWNFFWPCPPTSSCPRSCWRVPYYNLFHIFCSLFSLNFQRGFMFGGSISFTFWQGMICVLLFRFLRIWLKWFCVASLPTRKVLKDKENRANRIWKRFDHKK